MPSTPGGTPKTVSSRAAGTPGPSFAVIMTVKNGRPWIERAIGSILPALGTEGEIVVVDAVSTDGTTEVLRDLSQRVPLRLVVQACSMGVGRHLGIQETSAPIVITQVDADVEYRADALRTGVDYLRRNPGTGLALVIGLHDPDPDGTKLFVWDRAFYLKTPGYPDANQADDVVAVRQALLAGKVRRCIVERVGDDLRVAGRDPNVVRDPWKKGPGFLGVSRRRYAEGWTWRLYVRFLWATRRTFPRFLAGLGLASLARLTRGGEA
ncbi:MAG: glycosyltransferase family 2 protein [Euryarchaeota archaeon]|nr:glycosyltransferase family 2 protein [Euryarchaeota archaeon]